MTTYTKDLVTGMQLEAPVYGTFTKSEPYSFYPDGEPRRYRVTYQTLYGPKVHIAADNEHWTLTPEHSLVWVPYELYALRDGDSLVFIGAEVLTEAEAREWAATHYPTARFEVDEEARV